MFKIVNEQTRKTVANPALRALQEGVVVGLANHTILIARDGMERPIDDSAAPIRDADGKTAGAVLVFRDITARKKAEEGLAERVRLMSMSAEVGSGPDAGKHVAHALNAVPRPWSSIWTGRLPASGPSTRRRACWNCKPAPGCTRTSTGPMARAGRQAQDRPDRPGAEAPPDQCYCRRPSCAGTRVGPAGGLVAFAGYPLTVEDRLVGVMGVFARHELTTQTLEAMAAVADQIALGIERKRAEQEVGRLLGHWNKSDPSDCGKWRRHR